MALPTTDVRLGNIPLRFFTIGGNLHTALKQGFDGSGDGPG